MSDTKKRHHQFRWDDLHDAKDLMEGAIKQVDAYIEHGQLSDARRQFYGQLIEVCGNYIAARLMGLGDET